MCGVQWNKYTQSYWVCVLGNCDGEHHYLQYLGEGEQEAA